MCFVVFIFVLLGKNIGRQTATRIHEQKALMHVQPHRTLVERVESEHFFKMLSDETCCGWRVGTKSKFFYR